MEVEEHMCGGTISLNEISIEDKETILDFCKNYGIDLTTFGDQLDAEMINNPDKALKVHIKNTQTTINKERELARKHKQYKQGKATHDQTQDDFEAITDKLELFMNRAADQQCEVDFVNRQTQGKIVKGWNNEVIPKRALESAKASLDFTQTFEVDQYDIFNLTAAKRADSLVDHLEMYTQIVKKELEIPEFTDLGTISSDVVTVIGRIAYTEQEEDTSAIELFNLSTENENGQSRVKLILEDKLDYAFFEGQIVVLEGISDKDTFHAQKLIDLPVKTNMTVNENKDEESMDEGYLNGLIFAGPYTFNENLKYTPLKHIASIISDQEPKFVVLTGPFVDVTHPQIQEGELFYNEGNKINCYEDIDLYREIRKYLENATYGVDTKIILIPSVNDIVSNHPFPQPPLSSKNSQKVSFLPNPARFNINGVEFGIVNSEVLRPIMSKMKFSQTKPRIQHMADKITSQRNFYPVYPPAESVPLDLSQLTNLQYEVSPDVLILISELPSFIQSCEDKALIVNPGFCVKRSSAGTYAEIVIKQKIECSASSEAKTLKEKLSIEIKQI
ncbi:unnamed protein product [Moneuplotes crassus]|uniref:DNA polymerase alpha subunit B n=1 Tax=Euplotes crassus TaxID=5936 RepID=A0AAD1UCZ4_EUPCR|nr:unnamed protein product [Moneuplotes crassus]